MTCRGGGDTRADAHRAAQRNALRPAIKRYYGNKNEWRKIYYANRNRLSDLNNLR
mgnify:CR=1 FL=1